MPDDWEGFPMRKDYPVQINQPVKTYEPLQVSEDEFVANMEAGAALGAARTSRARGAGKATDAADRCRRGGRRS